MKKALSLVFALVLVFALAIPAFATSTIDQDTTDDKGTTEVKFEISESYTVTIPATVTASTTGAEFTVSATSVIIAAGKKLNVALTYDGALDCGDVDLAYEIRDNGTAVATTGDPSVLAVAAGTDAPATGSVTLTAIVTGTLVNMGSYTDTLTFTCSVIDQQ